MTDQSRSNTSRTWHKNMHRAFTLRGTTFIDDFESNLYNDVIKVGDRVEFVLGQKDVLGRRIVKVMVRDTLLGYMPAEIVYEYAERVASGQKWHGEVQHVQCGFFDTEFGYLNDDVGEWQHGWVLIRPVFDGEDDSEVSTNVDE